MNLRDIVFEIFKDALPSNDGMNNFKIIVSMLILCYDVFCNKHDIPYVQVDSNIMIGFLYEIIGVGLRYWCWIYKIDNNDIHMITIVYVIMKYGQRKIQNISMNNLHESDFVSAEFRNIIDLDV